MIKSLRILAAATFAFAISQFASAVPMHLNGNITFSGGVTLDTDSVETATAVTGFDAVVESVSGDFLATVAANDVVSFVAPWSFNSGAVTSFWSVGGFSFDLVSSYIDYQNNGALVVLGTGYVSGNGYDETMGSWTLTAQDPSAADVFSFSASTAVPDSGTSLVLLGMGLVGLVAIRRKRR